MARPVLLLAGAGLFAGLVAAYGAFAWIETEDRVLGAAEAQGRAVLSSVASGVRSSLDASREVDRLVADRLFELAERADIEIADEPAEPDGAVARFREAHALAGLALLGDDFSVRAASIGNWRVLMLPAGAVVTDAGRAARLDAELIAARAREAGLDAKDRIAFGFGESPFSARPIYLVGVRAKRLRGFLLLRQDAAPLEAFRAQAGVAKLLRDAAGAGIAYLVVQGKDGRVLAASDARRIGEPMPAPSPDASWQEAGDGGRVLDVSLPLGADHLRVGLAAGPVEDLIAGGRRNVLVFSATSLASGAVIVVLLFLRSRRLAEIEERERFASLGRLAAGVAHEIRSPLNALSMAAQRLQREAAPTAEPERQRFAELTAALRAGIARLDGTIREFLALGQDGPPAQRAAVDVAALVEEVVAAEDADARRAPPPTPLVVLGDRPLLAKALANLVRNARQIAPGTVAVAWRRDGGVGVIEVTDGGPGVPIADRERMFEPFFTTRPGGTGLGLAIARDAVERQGGRIAAGAAPGGGARFTIELAAEGG